MPPVERPTTISPVEFGELRADVRSLKEGQSEIKRTLQEMVATAAHAEGESAVRGRIFKYGVPAVLGLLAGGLHSAKDYAKIVGDWWSR
jgi:hypothetical protein